jgi:hypothetical protein
MTALATATTPAFTPVHLELDQAEARRILRVNRTGSPVGYRRLSAAATTEPCDKGCLAPGSSAHFHTVTTGWLLIGTTGYVEVDAGLTPQAVGMLHPFAPASRKPGVPLSPTSV